MYGMFNGATEFDQDLCASGAARFRAAVMLNPCSDLCPAVQQLLTPPSGPFCYACPYDWPRSTIPASVYN